MPTIEKRVQALEQDNAAHKATEALLTTAIHALASKEAFEKLQETVELTQQKNDKIFDALNAHNVLTNERLGDLQTQLIEQDGKIVGLQTEMRQRFAEQDGKITAIDGKVVGLQTEMRQRFAEVNQRFSEQDSKITAMDSRLTAMDSRLTTMDSRLTTIDSRLAQQTEFMRQILARLPEQA